MDWLDQVQKKNDIKTTSGTTLNQNSSNSSGDWLDQVQTKKKTEVFATTTPSPTPTAIPTPTITPTPVFKPQVTPQAEVMGPFKPLTLSKGLTLDLSEPKIQQASAQPTKDFLDNYKPLDLFKNSIPAINAVEVLKGFFGEHEARIKRYEDPNVKFEPKNLTQKVGVGTLDLMTAVVEMAMTGQSATIDTGVQSLSKVLSSSKTVATVSTAVSNFTQKQFASLVNKFSKSPLTFKDIEDVTRGKASAEKVTQYVKAKETGLLDQIISAHRETGGKPKQRVYDFLKNTYSNVKDFLKDLKKTVPEETKLLKPGEYTPQEIRTVVTNTSLENTKDGKELIKASLQAEEAGRNVIITETKSVITGTQSVKNELSKALVNSQEDSINIKTIIPEKVNPFPRKPENFVVENNIEIPVDKIRFGRDTLSKKRLIRISQATSEINDPISVVYEPKTDLYTIVDDGNHRLANAIIKGNETLKVTNVYKPKKSSNITLAPSTAHTPQEVVTEASKAGVNNKIKEGWIKGTNQKEIKGYEPSLVTKSDLKTIVSSSKEFADSPVLTVTMASDPKTGENVKLLTFEGKKTKFSIRTTALGLNDSKLNLGDKVNVDLKSLKVTGTSPQMRVYKNNEVFGFNPRNLEDPFSSKATKEIEKIVKQSEIADILSKKLNIPIRRGKFRRGGALGIYKYGPKVIRIKSGGLNTIFHEVGHYLDDVYKLSENLSPKERKALMTEYSYEYANQPDKQQKEALAEFIRYRLTGQEEKINKYAPVFKKEFDAKIESMPEVKQVLDEAQQSFQRWQEQPATAKVLSHISIGPQNGMGLKDKTVNTLHDLYTIALDDLHPLSEFTAIAQKNLKSIDSSQNPYLLARNLRGWTGKAELFLNKGTFGKTFWKTNEKGKTVMDFKGKSYSEIMKPVEEAGNMDDFRVYIVSQRIVNDLAPRGIKSGINLRDAKAALEELDKKHPEFAKIAEERRKYKDDLLVFAKENNLIGEKGLTKIRELNKFHAPFYRVMEETTQKFLGKSKFAGNLNNPIKKIKGSEREIIDPLESDVKDTYAIINASERNNIGIAMANLASKNYELGRLFEEVVRPMNPVNLNVVDVIEKIMKETGEEIPITDDMAEATITMFRPTRATGPNMLNVNFGDDKMVFQVDPDLFKAIQGLELEDAGILMKIMSFPAKVLRAGATLTPDFSVRNPFRDQFTAMVYSRYGFIPGVDLIRGMFELFKKGDVYNLWKAGGGEHAMTVSLDREVLQQNLKELFASPQARALKYVKNPLKFLQIISELGEAGTRLGEMRKALEAGADPLAGSFASREVTLDFARIGAKTRAMNMITAFWNANVQGTDKMIRSFKEKPFRTLWKALMGITVPSILLYMANRDDPRWKEIPQWQKNLFWIILTPNHIIRIPKPFELGVLFGSVPERTLEVIDKNDPEVFNELKNSILSGFTPGFIPTGLIPIIENITNYSFFNDRPIVSRGQENLPPEAQAGTYTSETAKIIGEALKYSPSKVDNLIYGYTGGLGRYGVSALDKILTGTGISNPPVAPAINFEDTPVIKAFMIRNPIGSASESVNRVYNLYGKTSSETAYLKKMIESGEKDKAIAYVKAHPEIVNASQLSQLVSSFSDMNKAINQIRQSREISPEKKRDAINKINELETKMSAMLLDEIYKKE